MKKFLSVFLAVTFIISIMGTTASAAVTSSGKTIKADRVVITGGGTKKLRVGKTMLLDFKVYAKDDDFAYEDCTWLSDDDDIAYVDNSGEVEGVEAGEVTITVRLYDRDKNNKKVIVGSGSITIEVTGGSGTSASEKSKESSVKSSSTSSKASDSSLSGEKVSSAAVTSAVKKAVQKGKTTTATFKDAGSISAASLQSAAASMKSGGGVVLLNFDTMEDTKTRQARLTINPADADKASGNIKLGAYTNEKTVGSVKTGFEKTYKNKAVIIKTAQSGSYGMRVSFVVKMGTTSVKEKNLKLYSYDKTTNKYTEVKNANIWLDKSGYVHFTTTTGGYFIVSDGALARK